jgi:GNAT superfamily N-acetyltransferase
VARCFVAVETATNTIAGYYTLVATSVPTNDLPTAVLKRLARDSILPVALVGRLAVDQPFHGKGLGSAMLADVALGALKSETTAFALIVDAKDENAITFYRPQGRKDSRSPPVALCRSFCLSEPQRKGLGQETIMFLLHYQFLPPSRKGNGPSFCG